MGQVTCSHFFLGVASTKRVGLQNSQRCFVVRITGLGQSVALPAPGGRGVCGHVSYHVGVTQLNSGELLSQGVYAGLCLLRSQVFLHPFLTTL